MTAPEGALPSPGPSFLRELPLSPEGDRVVGMSHPQTMADGWWVSLLWCERGGFLERFSALGPTPEPPGSPMLRLGPALAGLLSGFIAEAGGRQQLRLRLGQPPANETRPWDAPLAVLAALRFEPARVATMRESELASTVLEAFRDALLRISG